MVRVLHFADAHIDMANYGKHDPQTGLPYRVLDFLKALDQIIDTAINEKVDLVLFAGDTYRDRTPAPTFQREWGKRIMRLSRAGIPTLLLVGNHDLSPVAGRAYAFQEFATLDVPHVRVIDKPVILGPDDLEGLPLTVIALPWISRASVLARLQDRGEETGDLVKNVEEAITEWVQESLGKVPEELPLLLTAHASVAGAQLGGERTIMLGSDVTLPFGLVSNPRIQYTALGHIHKKQDMNEGMQPPIVYPGSIERVDFGEVEDDKFFVIAQIDRSGTKIEFRKIEGLRQFYDVFIHWENKQQADTNQLIDRLPTSAAIAGAIIRLIVEYPVELDALIDEHVLREHTKSAFEFHFIRRPQHTLRARLPQDLPIALCTPAQLTDLYWRTVFQDQDYSEYQKLAEEIISQAETTDGEML